MGRRGGIPPDYYSQIIPFSPVVKRLAIINAVIWFFGVVILEQFFLTEPWLTMWFGLVPYRVIHGFAFWQPFTYLFIHSTNPTHIIFNLLLLWWLGSELEREWGSRFFTIFYFLSGIGAALLFVLACWIYAVVKGQPDILAVPVIGASAAIFGLLMAYGMVFGERVVYFMFFFPMKAKYFVAILGLIEVVLVLNNGLFQGKVANLAHIGGLLTGYLVLKFWPYIDRGGQGGSRSGTSKRTRNRLRLVVNNQEMTETDKPKYWN